MGTYIIGTTISLSIKQKHFFHSYSHVPTLFSIIPSHFSSCAVQNDFIAPKYLLKQNYIFFYSVQFSLSYSRESVIFLFVSIKILFLKNWGVFHICFFLCAKKKQDIVLLRKNQYQNLPFVFISKN